ncbi:MAG TPA: tetraacyldisaccharide 4'-kinase [Rhodanobacteraceae bacterium]|nr:tetraacyldisaccharide 4'-kinase [Rhodanobacteraceae bacterium]
MVPGQSLQRRWYEDGASPWWTLPLAASYGSMVRLRRALYRRGWLRVQRLPLPVIVVGNIVAGGAGKTPLTIALVEALRARGFKPGVVSRGYGGTAQRPMLLDAQPDPAMVGDEPALIRMRTGVPVAIGADRPAAAALLPGAGVDVIIADDGLQHYALARDVEVCVVDGARGLGNGRLLPAGPLRESPERLDEVDFVIVNGGNAAGARGMRESADRPRAASAIPMRLQGDVARNLADASLRPLTDFSGSRVHAVAGIGHPPRFFDALRRFGIEVVEHAFPDHHRYIAADFDFGGALPVLMTEKDAVKCRAFAQPDWWSVPVTGELPEAFFDAVVAKIAKRV